MCIPDINESVRSAMVCQRCGAWGETTLEINHKEDCPVKLAQTQKRVGQAVRDVLAGFSWDQYKAPSGWYHPHQSQLNQQPEQIQFSLAYDSLSKRIADYLIEKKLVK